ncbi:peptidoglycan-binding protein [Streptomyces sp. NBC_01725]|uniref:peptidoglycan-binding protein n=1 Tax=Streptomyces sp. NBC_01725 TaxID=2975923 RepID=UPI002E2BCB86|nr:peptidoglycan-binding protein [Streptomyces sp. NBC_01725]
MNSPVFEEYEPACDCPCGGCAEQRRLLAQGLPLRAGGHPAAHGARRVLVLATAAGVALGVTGAGASEADAAWPALGTATAEGAAPSVATAAVAEPDPATPQGASGPLHGRPSAGPSANHSVDTLRRISRADIINRAKRWVSAKVPYSMTKYWSDGYRQDCSGYVSMAWNLDGNEWTGSLSRFGTRIDRSDLQPGDILLFHNPKDPNKGSHVTIFGGWTDYTHDYYIAYEQTKPNTRAQSTPMAYWNNSASYVAYRYNGVTSGTAGSPADTPDETPAAAGFPGAKSFGPGADNAHVTRLGEMLVGRGGGRFYDVGPGPGWGEADRRATEAFQRAQGWRGAEADGLPGPDTWRYLVNGLGKDIPKAGAAGPGGTSARPAFPGTDRFRPGKSNSHVTRLGEQLVKRGYGRHYVSGPGPRWGEADRRNVEAFQRAQGWRGSAADGYPGPETWRRLFA